MIGPGGEGPSGGRILVVDDDRDMCDLIAAILGERGFETACRTSAEAALDVVRGTELDAVLTDLDLGGTNGIDLCARIVSHRPDVPVTVLTAFGNLETAVAAMRVGAYDFLTKPPDVDALPLAVERAVRHRLLRHRLRCLRGASAVPAAFGELVGESPPMRRVYALLARISDSNASVLVTGETGTGKELAAHALHAHGPRRDAPFVGMSCGAVPATLLESELFGHVRGAFTDAHATRTGLLARANGGTVFLDEIGELPLALQPKLLRALQEKVIRPVGSDVEAPIDVRIVTATNRDLEAGVAAGTFRRDLYFRINVLHVAMPPLRTRGDDVLLLARHFIDLARRRGSELRALSEAAAERLLCYHWPGNVRELQNCIERAVALAAYDEITVHDLPDGVRTARAVEPPATNAGLASLDEIERHHILHVLESVSGNRTLAARILGLDRKTLYRKLGPRHPRHRG